MLMGRRILGLDLGSHTVKVAEVVHSLRETSVAQLREVPVPPGRRMDPAQLRELVRSHALPTDYVVTALPGDRLSTRRLTFPFRDRRRIAQAVPFELEGQVPFDLADFFIDWELCGGDRSQTDVIAVLASKTEVAELLAELGDAKLPPRVIEAEGLVLGNLVSLFELPGTRLLLDLGHRKTTVCLLVDGTPMAARTLPVAGRALTQAIATDRGVSESEAERLKHERGILDSDAAMPNALAALDRLARELVRTLGALEPVLGGTATAKIGSMTLLGGTARLHRIDEYLAERTGIPTSPLPLPSEPLRSQVLAAGDPLLFAPALALALRGGLRPRTHMNFRQDEFAHRIDLRKMGREFRSSAVLAAAALFLLIALGIGQIVLDAREADRLEARAVELYAQAFPGRPTPPNVTAAMRKEVKNVRDRADLLGVYRGNLSALDLLAEISKQVPKDVEVVFDELTIDRQVVRIRGHTKSFEAVDRLAAELRRFEPFGQVRVAEIKEEARRDAKSFSVTISLTEGDAT